MHGNRQNVLVCTMQDWHQKLHNNTTPDDVIICEAYIKFLEGNGDNGSYWAHLNDNGITRQRLESFDRAIKACHLLFNCLSAHLLAYAYQRLPHSCQLPTGHGRL